MTHERHRTPALLPGIKQASYPKLRQSTAEALTSRYDGISLQSCGGILGVHATKPSMNPENQSDLRDSIKEKPHYSYHQVYRLMGCAPNAGVDA